MLLTGCSEKLRKYLKKIETETGRQINIQEMPKSELYKMKSAFVHHPTDINILLASGSQITDPEIEQSIAHEATHGLLVYKMKYCVGFFRRTPSAKEKKIITLIFTMVTDIVVNKMIQLEGFLAYSPKYKNMVNQEIVAIQRGVDLYNELLDDPPYRDKHMVFRFILAWGYLKYNELDEVLNETLIDFTKIFKRVYPEQYKIARKIFGMILTNDIFSAEGYKNVIKKVLKQWDVEDLVELKTV